MGSTWRRDNESGTHGSWEEGCGLTILHWIGAGGFSTVYLYYLLWLVILHFQIWTRSRRSSVMFRKAIAHHLVEHCHVWYGHSCGAGWHFPTSFSTLITTTTRGCLLTQQIGGRLNEDLRWFSQVVLGLWDRHVRNGRNDISVEVDEDKPPLAMP